MKFLHCADLHLGGANAEERMRAFYNLLSFAKREGVGVLLAAGDLFDAPRADERTRRAVFEAFAGNPALCVMIAAGNHDPLGPGGNYDCALPANVYVFGGEWSCAEIPAYGVRVWGASFTGERQPPFSPTLKRRRLTEGLYDLGVLHGDLLTPGARSDYRAVSREAIAGTGVGYLALGHIHARREVQRAGRTLYAYSGCLQGAGFDETGEKGAYLGTIEGNALEMAFVKLCGSMTLEKTLNVDGCGSIQEVAARYDAKIGPQREHRVKLTLTGSPRGFAVDADALLRLLAGRAKQMRIEDETRPEMDWEQTAREDTLRGAYCRRMLEKMRGAQESGGDAAVIRAALRLGLEAFEGEVTQRVD
jgi:exonuclease SbcD